MSQIVKEMMEPIKGTIPRARDSGGRLECFGEEFQKIVLDQDWMLGE